MRRPAELHFTLEFTAEWCKNFLDEVRGTGSHDKPKKLAFSSHDIAKECVMNVLAPTTPLTKSQQISPNRAKNGVYVLSKVKNGPKRP